MIAVKKLKLRPKKSQQRSMVLRLLCLDQFLNQSLCTSDCPGWNCVPHGWNQLSWTEVTKEEWVWSEWTCPKTTDACYIRTQIKKWDQVRKTLVPVWGNTTLAAEWIIKETDDVVVWRLYQQFQITQAWIRGKVIRKEKMQDGDCRGAVDSWCDWLDKAIP